MDIREALDIVIAQTRHERFRELCDPKNKDYVPAYVDWVISQASAPQGGPAPAQPAPPPAPAQTITNIARMKACPSWEASTSCGCGVNICKSNRGRGPDPSRVSHLDCFACMESPDSPANAIPPEKTDPAP